MSQKVKSLLNRFFAKKRCKVCTISNARDVSLLNCLHGYFVPCSKLITTDKDVLLTDDEYFIKINDIGVYINDVTLKWSRHLFNKN